MQTNESPSARLDALTPLLARGEAGTQEEIREHLEKQGFEVTQSTVSRDLRRLGAIKAIDESGRTVYRFPLEGPLPTARVSLGDQILDIQTNGSLIILHTSPGSASLIARHLDHAQPGGILGTIAGDDTIFVAPPKTGEAAARKVIEEIRSAFAESGQA